MRRERGNLIYIKDSDHADAESYIRSILDRNEILKWAYILHDKDIYNEHDMNSKRFGAQYCWADGFEGMEEYSSKEEYIEDQMKKPPFIGDKMTDMWVVLVITDKSCNKETVAGWFDRHFCEISRAIDRSEIIDQIKRLTYEDKGSRLIERHLYPDDEVKANFDFRSYVNDQTKVNRRLKRLKDIFIPRHILE